MSLFELTCAVAGVALLVSALGWRWTSRRRAADLLHDALNHPRPAVRLAAVHAVGSSGLERHARVLARRCREEDDPEVRAALAQEIARNLWEPADTEALVELRLWAHCQLDAQRHAAVPAQPVMESILEPIADPMVEPIPLPTTFEADPTPVAEVAPEPPAVTEEIPTAVAAAPAAAPRTRADDWHSDRANSDELLARSEAILGRRVRTLTLYRFEQAADDRYQAAS